MEIRETKVGEFVVLEPAGRLDTKTAPELEKKLLDHLAAGQRRFVVDFGGVEFLSSAGLRVLLMLAKKLTGAGGHLALSALNEHVREVFDIAGFSSVFTIRATAAEAMASAPVSTARADGAPSAAGNERAEKAAKALGLSRTKAPRVAPDASTMELAKRAAQLLCPKPAEGSEPKKKRR